MVSEGLAYLAQHPGLIEPADLEQAQTEWAQLGPMLASREAFEAHFPNIRIQPVHGDAPSYNLIYTTSGVRYADFEDVTLGPAEWDLSGFGPEATAIYNGAASALGLRPLNPEVQRVMDAARNLQMVTCLGLVPELPLLATGLAPSLAQWRLTPLSGTAEAAKP